MCHPCRAFLVILDRCSHRSPFTSFGASAVGYVVSSFWDSLHYSMSALRLRECYEALLFPDLLDIRTQLGRILPHEIV